MQTPQGAPEYTLRRIAVPEVQQLMEQDLLIHHVSYRNGQYRSKYPAHKGGGQSLHLHNGAGLQPIAGADPVEELTADCSSVFSQQPAEEDIRKEIAGRKKRNACGVDHQQPVGDALGRTGKLRQDMAAGNGGKDRGIGRGTPNKSMAQNAWQMNPGVTATFAIIGGLSGIAGLVFSILNYTK